MCRYRFSAHPGLRSSASKKPAGQELRTTERATTRLSTVIDTTERKRAKQELRQSEAELRTITDAIRQCIGVLVPDGKDLYANRVALDYSGLTLDEVTKEGLIERLCHP